jgi:transposase
MMTRLFDGRNTSGAGGGGLGDGGRGGPGGEAEGRRGRRAVRCGTARPVRHPITTVADVAGVAAQTVLRWVAVYREGGTAGLRSKPSKLDETQKATVLSWLGAGETAKGESVHWTLGRPRGAIGEEFEVDLCVSAIWVWLRKEGWAPKVPRSRRHAADAAQDEFKKNGGDSEGQPRRGYLRLRRGPHRRQARPR